MHVDWRWIKQRPHFLAEEAAHSGHRVRVLFKPNGARRSLPRNRSQVRRYPLLPVPHSRRHGPLALGGRWLQRIYVGIWIRAFRPDVIYVSHPILVAVLPRLSAHATLVYDCMDDAVAMASPEDKDDVAALEAHLVRDAQIVVATSQKLASDLGARFHLSRVPLVRNGIADSFVQAALSGRDETPTRGGTATAVAMYVGTIGRWLDWDALERLRDGFHGVVRLVGPRPPAGLVPPGIECPGVVEHSAVARTLRDSSVLLLPFAPSEIVAAVDPVKLYEYIAARRPIVARYFPELEIFAEFVTFYERTEDIVAATRIALNAELAPLSRAKEFLAGQLWSGRWRAIEDLVASLAPAT